MSIRDDGLVIVITDANATLGGESVGPPAADLNVRLGDAAVAKQKPKSKDGLSQDIEDGVGHDFTIDRCLAGTIGKAPHAEHTLVSKYLLLGLAIDRYIHWVGGPQNEGEEGERAEEVGDLGSLGLDGGAAGQANVPDDKDVGNARDGIPAPLLARVLSSVGGEQTGQDHDEVCRNSHDRVGTINAGEQAKIQQQEGSGDSPINITSVVDLTAHLVVCVWDLAVGVLDLDAVQVNAVSGGHAEVGQGRGDGDHGGHVVVETLRHGDVPGQE